MTTDRTTDRTTGGAPARTGDPTGPTDPAGGPALAPPRRRAHVHEADLVRVLTFACVIGVHVTANTNPSASVAANAAVMLLHFTRSAFFALTGFVLVVQYLGRPVRTLTFWRRRMVLVGVPYLVWSLAYVGLDQYRHPASSVGAGLHATGDAVLFGTAWYHLYFLLVSLQVYLVFPAVLWLVRRTAGHHAAVLAVSAAVQLALLAWTAYAPLPGGVLGSVVGHRDVLLPTYQFYVLLGALAAAHLEAARAWVGAHTGAVVAALLLTAGVAEGVYGLGVARGDGASHAAQVLQPVMVPWSAAVVVGLFALGRAWSRDRARHPFSNRLVTTASDRSFGIFLVHPAVLVAVLAVGDSWLGDHVGAPWRTVVAYLATVAGAVVATEVLRRSPLSWPTTGRPRLRRGGS